MYEIYSKLNCQYCYLAKDALLKRNLNYVEFIIDEDITLEEVKAKFPNIKKVPIVLCDGQMIGTFENLIDHLNLKESSDGPNTV